MFHDRCPNAVMQTNSIPKNEIQVLWTAPPSNSGCVIFKATIVVTREIWYGEEGPLWLSLCESSEDVDNIEPPVLQTCCACHEAKYEVTFEGLWSRNTHPKDFPTNNFKTKFSDIIGASHSVDYKFWYYDEYASDGLKELAEEGVTKLLERELKNKSDHIRTIIKARGISYPNITGKTFAVFRVDNRHHLMSLVSMIHPSPDWIVGVSSLELCQQNCSWVESKTLNLYPWDAGTDNGTTYTSDDSPIFPREPIRRITTKSPTNSPFYDEYSNEMKPLARLILSRQRLYEKHNCEGPDSTGLPDLEEYCAVSEWQEWSPCNVDCGRGTRHRQRTYKLKVANQHKQRQTCKQQLTQRSLCYGLKPECPSEAPPTEECELTTWGKWSECSVTCGNGTKTRSRRYRTRTAAKHCQQVTNNPPKLEQNIPCEMPPCDLVEPISPECAHKAWSEWSTCSVTCGKGTKMRRKLSVNVEDLHKHNRISRQSFDGNSWEEDDGDTDGDNCERLIERVECFNDEAPTCDESTTIPALACGLPMDVGLCRSNVDRWHFNNVKGKCELFSYSGCEGNKNNFRTLEMCEHVCGDYQSK
ncbi:hypothetical protein AMK59_3362 [Oryctes borbonicus]|uniref:Spondin-1 n=1 Tax=Oryctes borbonicus TaxID=1629725 RepID=A0A0T6B756_9SCAR|nr:hypothetical protein AMK59_3362 [Oryctes borbonicus]